MRRGRRGAAGPSGRRGYAGPLPRARAPRSSLAACRSHASPPRLAGPPPRRGPRRGRPVDRRRGRRGADPDLDVDRGLLRLDALADGLRDQRVRGAGEPAHRRRRRWPASLGEQRGFRGRPEERDADGVLLAGARRQARGAGEPDDALRRDRPPAAVQAFPIALPGHVVVGVAGQGEAPRCRARPLPRRRWTSTRPPRRHVTAATGGQLGVPALDAATVAGGQRRAAAAQRT